MEFMIEYNESFRTTKIKFTKGPHRRYISRNPFWIKMMLYENDLMNL